jgi:hypothetical protein
MSEEEGVNVINGTDPNGSASRVSVSRSPSPSSRRSAKTEEEKPKKFLNGWTPEQERLMADWSDIASCYRWLHDQSEKVFHMKNLLVNIPVIILSTLGGTANFAAQSLFEDDENGKKYASFAIGGISIFAGMLTTIGNYLRYAQLEESHRVASITWGKFQRLLAVELSLNPNDRMDSLDFLKICRAELDRLIEQSPPIPKDIIHRFEGKFGSIKDLKRPDICGALEHTSVFQSSETRLKNMAAEAALMLRRKRQTLNELVSPQIEKKISEQVELRVQEAIEERKKKLEAEIELKKLEAKKTQDDFDRALDERKKKIQEEIDLEKKKLYQEPVHQAQVIAAAAAKVGGSQFESRLNYRRSSTSITRGDSSRKLLYINQHLASSSQQSTKSVNDSDSSKTTIEMPPKSTTVSDGSLVEDGNIIILSKD